MDHKQQHIKVCKDLCQNASDDATFLSTVISGDEGWIYSSDPETKQKSCQSQNSQEHAIIPKKKFVLRSQTVNSKHYCYVLRRLHEHLRRLLIELWRRKNWLFHQDNALSDVPFVTR
jgi:hypothetical protein